MAYLSTVMMADGWQTKLKHCRCFIVLSQKSNEKSKSFTRSTYIPIIYENCCQWLIQIWCGYWLLSSRRHDYHLWVYQSYSHSVDTKRIALYYVSTYNELFIIMKMSFRFISLRFSFVSLIPYTDARPRLMRKGKYKFNFMYAPLWRIFKCAPWHSHFI